MSFLSGLSHLAGIPVAAGAKAAGATLSLGGLVHNSEADRLTSIGHAITNPNQTLSNVGGLLTPSQTAFSSSSPAPAQIAAAGRVNSDSVPSSNGYSYLSGAGGGSSYDPSQLAAYDQSIGVTNNALGRLPNQLAIANANIDDQLRIKQNELDSAKAAAQNQYSNSSTQNRQSFVTDKNTIKDNASQGLQSLLRLLGAHGAGGSSDYLYKAPQAVASDAAHQQSGAGETYGQNQQNLDTNWGDFQNEDKKSRDQLNDWGSQQRTAAQVQADNNKSTLLQELAQLTSQRASYAGGNGVAASQPIIDQINQLAGQVDNLGRFSPTYTGNTPVYNAPTLDSYTVEATDGPQVTNASTEAATPFLSLLLANRKNQNQPLF